LGACAVNNMHTDTMVTTVVGQALDPGHRLGPGEHPRPREVRQRGIGDPSENVIADAGRRC